jgi:hypothetical protein
VLHIRDEGVRADASVEAIASVNLLQQGGVLGATDAS